MNKETGIQ